MSLREVFSHPENTQKLAEFFDGLVKKDPPLVQVTDGTESICTITQTDGVPKIVMSKAFITSLANYKLVVKGGFTQDRIYDDAKTPFVPGPEDYAKLVVNGFVVFENKSENLYNCKYHRNTIQGLDINIVNTLKRNNLDQVTYQATRNYLIENGVLNYLIGEPWPEVSKQPDEISSPVIATKYVVTEKIVYVDRAVVTEKPVYVEKIVINEKAVPIEKIVYKETPIVGPDGPIFVQPPVAKAAPSGPIKRGVPVKKIVDPDEDVDDKVLEKKKVVEEQSEESSDEEEEEETSEVVEEEEESSSSSVAEKTPPKKKSKRAEEASEAPLKVKGTWLNPPNNTVLKSGQYVYRVIKKAEGPSEMHAIGKWNKDKWAKSKSTDPLTRTDMKEIKALGHLVAEKKN